MSEIAEPRLGERLLDRVNAILVREIQQALNSRIFVVTLSLSLGAILCIGLVIAAEGGRADSIGRDAFLWTLLGLTPVAFLIVPMQAFFSTRTEVTSGTVDHLLLTHLSASAIVRGKLLAAFTQFILFLSLFAP
ncbi:MAG: hypothetical protein HC813_03135 [Planctomycetes bacterium]|nr:hypothetical protein [Planctomycetota bacterium]